MGKGAGEARAVSTLSPAQFQQPYIEQLLSEARRIYETHIPKFYPGSTVADFTPVQTWGQRRVEAGANQFADQAAPYVIEAVTRGLQGQRNPWVDEVADIVTRRMNQNLTENVLPALQSGAVATGTLGGSRQALAQGLAAREHSRELADALSNLYAQEFNRGTQTMLQSLQLAPTALQAVLGPGLALAGIGEQQRALEQERINEAVARWAFEQQLPYQRLAEYFNIASRPFGSVGTQATSGTGGGAAGTIGGILSLIGTLLPVFGIGGGR